MKEMAKRVERPNFGARKVGDVCLCFHAQRAARALARRFDEAFRPLELTNWQFTLLVVLDRDEAPPMGRVANMLSMDRTTLTAALKPLQRRGLVAVAADPEDRRSRLTSITPAGRALLVAAAPVWRRTHGAIEREISNADRLRADLRSLSQGDTK
jgi:DNA-binding MarR family transcriptional regulator